MIRFAAFTDLHYDHIFDGDRRLEEFLNNIKNDRLDFIISLGDLCYPTEKNKHIIAKLNSLNIPVYYTIGNHDSDCFSQDKVIEFLDLKETNYSFVIEGTKFIVLNSCYMKCNGVESPYYKDNYKKNADIYPVIPILEQEWLVEELHNKDMNYVIFSHHSLINNFMNRGIANREYIRKILSSRKILMCMNGHDHGDDYKVVNGILYFTLNSMSYIWHGMKDTLVYHHDIYKEYPFLKDLILYRDALHCIVEIYEDKLKIKGIKGEYQSISPSDVGIEDMQWNGVSIQPIVSDFESII
ncbi:metallophosphoesterase family protein [Lacrimispora sp. 38-1]|uniref:metallophosphoesterase family protein n=1 Tax=Lacrimispora sp. 38-1 TaxID=3125778 RepID=UPI003CF34101